MHKLTIETDPNLKGLLNKQITDLYQYVYQLEGIENSEVTIVFGDKKLLQKLKKEFFDLDRTTDVIAFRLNEYKEKDVDGEIYICLPVAKENAKFYDEPYEKEIARLIVHGCLHLIGYDDGTERDRMEMQRLENKYLEERGF